ATAYNAHTTQAQAVAGTGKQTVAVLGTSSADSLALTLPAKADSVEVEVSITTAEGCTYSRKQTIRYNPWEDLSGYVANDTAVCAVSSTVLLADIESLDILKHYTMQWSNARGTANPLAFLANDPIRVDSTNSYYLRITRPSDGCHYYDTVNVQVDPMPAVYMPDTIFKCAQTTRVYLEPDSVKYSKPNAYYWYFDAYHLDDNSTCSSNLSHNDELRSTFTPCPALYNKNGWASFHLRTEGIGACAGKIAYDTVTIVFRGMLKVDVKNVSVCLDDSTDATVVVTGLHSATVDSFAYVFMRKDSVLRNATEDTLLYRRPDTTGTFVYTDTLRVWNADRCMIEKPYTVTFTATARILQDTITICTGDTATLTVANATRNPQWKELGKNTTLYTGNNYKATPTKTTTY
ncbi:MAG: hypothetical protein K2I83_01500, partial [Bacteroidales bacterium]|nr:hypothetical protein [Bacteroidales bacterium]